MPIPDVPANVNSPSDEALLSTQGSAHIFTAREKLSGALGLLRQRVAPARNLVAGPFAGEFGYELMLWQGFVRAHAARYERTYVITYPGRDFLYENCTVIPHDIELRTAGYGYGLMTPDETTRGARAVAAKIGITDYDVFTTQHISTRYHRRFLCPQKMIRFDAPPLPDGVRDIAFHFRAVDKDGPDKLKNYSRDAADELVRLLQTRGLRICCIGHPAYSYAPTTCEDLRNENLAATVSAICSTRLVAGENSGPMHLANLCARPTLLWAAAQWRIDYSLRWNPFNVPIFIAANNTHQPAPTLVTDKIMGALASLQTWIPSTCQVAQHPPIL